MLRTSAEPQHSIGLTSIGPGYRRLASCVAYVVPAMHPKVGAVSGHPRDSRPARLDRSGVGTIRDMNSKLAASLMKNIGGVDPPGCLTEFVEHPNPRHRRREAVTVGIVMEHRFAFHYWVKCKEELRSTSGCDERQFRSPDLISWDWHDDCGADSDVIAEQLAKLNQSAESDVALFCWAGLNQLNDGHILPAVWLNAIGNFYIIRKQKRDSRQQFRTFSDRFGRSHQIHYFRSMENFPKTFERTNSETGVIWDIDLDYFTQGRSVPDRPFTRALSGDDVKAMLSADVPWMQLILRDLKAITVALEPTYTGGLASSLNRYSHWESALFTAPISHERCKWRCKSVHLNDT